ncbi:hypothetical protein SH139x_005652 [Planctomycetaceae bacterium SH139]
MAGKHHQPPGASLRFPQRDMTPGTARWEHHQPPGASLRFPQRDMTPGTARWEASSAAWRQPAVPTARHDTGNGTLARGG